jgi:hypothetical protein
MVFNFAFCKNAFIGKGGIISLVNGELTTVAALRGFMQPYALISEGPRGGLKTTSVVDAWMGHAQRLHIDAVQTRADQPRPTFFEDGQHIYNRYRPPTHPTEGGEIKTFVKFMMQLVPDKKERKWVWHWVAHKARRPWVPMIAIIMVAEKFGSGRGTLFEILGLLFGKRYVVPCSFTEFTGTSASARFNARMADALIVTVNEAVAEDGHQQAQRRLTYEALKNVIEPSPTALRRFEEKHQHAYAQQAAMSVLIVRTSISNCAAILSSELRCRPLGSSSASRR